MNPIMIPASAPVANERFSGFGPSGKQTISGFGPSSKNAKQTTKNDWLQPQWQTNDFRLWPSSKQTTSGFGPGSKQTTGFGPSGKTMDKTEKQKTSDSEGPLCTCQIVPLMGRPFVLKKQVVAVQTVVCSRNDQTQK